METDKTTIQMNKRKQTSHIVPNGRCENCLQRREIADVLIIGAGAAGIAVALSVLEKVRDGWHIDSMTIVEKSDEPGRGTAYSSAMDGTVCNQRDDEMSLLHNQPNHFKEWAQKHPKTRKIGGDHSERQVYGDYLQDMLRQVNATAFDQMVDFRFIRQEAIDMNRYIDGEATIYGVKLNDGCSVYAKNVILALGSFRKKPELDGTPGYFSSPWPSSKLDAIPPDAAVGITGTGVSAFDVLARLSKNRHRGMIYMMSESGRLPRLERPPRNFPFTHEVHALIRGLEKWKPSLDSFLDDLDVMLLEYDGVNVSVPQTNTELTSYADRAYHSLLSDIGKFDNDEGRSLVIDALRPVAERIWTSAAPLEKEYLERHQVWNDICQETIPRNVVAIYTIHIAGFKNLEIIKDHGVGHKPGYFLMGVHRRAAVDYVIDTADLKYDLTSIAELNSPLLKEMLQKGLVIDEPAGGIKVGVADHQVIAADDKPTTGLYAIGSLTKGTHYFVEDIRQITSHAQRISDSIVGLPRSNPTQVALFVGRDLFSTAIAASAIPTLLSQGHMPYVFLLEPPTDSLYLSEKEYLYWYFEFALLQQVLVPDFKMRGGSPGLALVIDGAENEYGILVKRVRDFNEPAFVAGLQEHNIDIGFMLGCDKAVGEDLRNAFHLFRLKAGLHPLYQSTREVMEAGGDRFGYTLNRLGSAQDEEKKGEFGGSTGASRDTFFASKDHSIASAPCACSAMFDSHELGAELVVGTVDKYARAGLAGSVRRDYTPPPDDRNEPITLVAIPAMLDRVLGKFATTPEGEDRIIRSIEDDIRDAGIAIDKRELDAWKAARNLKPGQGFI